MNNTDSGDKKIAKHVEVRLNKEGWFLCCDSRSVGPFNYLNDDVDDVKVSEQLGTTPREVWFARIRVSSRQSKPQKLPDPEQIQIKDFTIIPSFKDPVNLVHPAIDVLEDRAYVGAHLPCVVISNSDKDGKEAENRTEDMLFLVTSLKEKILAHKDILRKLNLKLATRPLMTNRWRLDSIGSYLAGESQDPVDPVDVYTAVKEAWTQYIDFDDQDYYDLLTLWTIGTYFFHVFNTYPYIYVGGTKRTGKTKALTLCSCLAFNAIFSANISTSSVFRLVQSCRCTLLVDEVEQLANPERRQDFRSLLLSGYKKGGMVYRTEKDRHERHSPEAFGIYSPKMLANIMGLEDVLEDRCIPIVMRRSSNRAIVDREVTISHPVWQDIRDRLYVLFLTYWGQVVELSESFSVGCEGSACYEPPEGTGFLSSRELELWKPILVLAQFFDKYLSSSGSYHAQPTLPTLIFELAKRKSKERQVEEMTETGDNVLIQTLLAIVTTDEYYSLKTIRTTMASRFTQEEKWLTNEWVGRALKRLGFTDKRRVGKGTEYRLTKEGVKDLAQRMAIPEIPPGEDQPALMVSVKDWCKTRRDERSEISLEDLAKFIQEELKQEPQRVINEAFDQAIIQHSPKPGKAVVV